MSTAGVRPKETLWLTENGPRELEQLFRAVVFNPSSPILVADNDGQYREASVGAVMTNAFAFGGLNAVLVLQAFR